MEHKTLIATSDFRVYLSPVPKRGPMIKYWRVVVQRLTDGVTMTGKAQNWPEAGPLADKLIQKMGGELR